MPSVSEEPRPTTKKPSNSAFKQQRLPAWQPILTAGTVLPTLFIIGLAFIPIGIVLLVTSNQVQEHQVDYTYCNSTEYGNITCDELIADRNGNESCTCEVPLYIDTPMKKDVFVYYGLTNFYQNHRRYVKSRDDSQLLGYLSSDVSDSCKPFDYHNKIPIAPCGAIANSLFNDEIKLYLAQDEVPLLKKGIAWKTDKDIKFKNPTGVSLEKAFNHTTKPLNWTQYVWELDPDDDSNNGFKNEDLIVWMRTAALPTFRKLYRRVNHTGEFSESLPKGKYTVKITYRYRVTPFKGTKRVIVSNTSWLGGKNPFLGIAYIVVGSLVLLLAVFLLIIHFKYGKNTDDLVNITPRTLY